MFAIEPVGQALHIGVERLGGVVRAGAGLRPGERVMGVVEGAPGLAGLLAARGGQPPALGPVRFLGQMRDEEQVSGFAEGRRGPQAVICSTPRPSASAQAGVSLARSASSRAGSMPDRGMADQVVPAARVALSSLAAISLNAVLSRATAASTGSRVPVVSHSSGTPGGQVSRWSSCLARAPASDGRVSPVTSASVWLSRVIPVRASRADAAW